MKLKSSFIVQQIDDVQFIVPIGTEPFNGMIRNNQTAAFIVDCLKKETTEQEIIGKMTDAYDAPESVIAKDVHKVLETLREIGAIEE